MQSPRSQYLSENPMVDQLIRAVDLRIQSEETFKKNIVSQLKKLILTLSECDPSNARTALDLTQEQLRQIIIKLNDNSVISEGESSKIANIVKENNLFRGPTAPSSTLQSALPTPSTVPSLPTPPLTVPSAPPKRDLSVINPGAVPSNGRNPGLTPGRRGGRKTRRKGKSKRIV